VMRGAVSAEDRAVSMQLGGLRERCKLPQQIRVEPGRQTTLGAFLV